MVHGRRLVTAAAVLGLLAGCGSSGDAPTAAGSAAPSAAASPSCPSVHGGKCLGPLAAGTYTTTEFHPQLTYSVPAGWTNCEDLSGNFLLVPPGGTLDGVDAGTSDYVAAYSSAAPLKRCASGPNAAVETTPTGLRPNSGATRASTSPPRRRSPSAA